MSHKANIIKAMHNEYIGHILKSKHCIYKANIISHMHIQLSFPLQRTDNIMFSLLAGVQSDLCI